MSLDLGAVQSGGLDIGAIQSTAASGGITGDASITLGTLTLSATGTLKLQADAAITLGTLTLASAGTLALQGAASITLGSLTLSAAGTLAIQAAAAVTLDPLTLSSAGTLAIAGAASFTLDPLTLSATGSGSDGGAASITLGSLTLSATGRLAIQADVGVLLGPLTLIAAGGIPASSFLPGGTFRRPAWSLARSFLRRDWLRKIKRPQWSLNRIWRYTSVPNTIAPAILTKAVGDDRDYLFDFTTAPEIVQGATIGSAVIEGGTGLTIGTPTVLASTTDFIAAGKGVSVEISGGVDDTNYNLACKATLTTGRVLVIPGRVSVAADYE